MEIEKKSEQKFTRSEIIEKIETFEVLKRLNETEDFKRFKKVYIDEQTEALVGLLSSETIGSVERQFAIEKLIGVNNLKTFLDNISENLKKTKSYLEEAQAEGIE